MLTRANLLFAAAAALTMGLAPGIVLAKGAKSSSSSSKPSGSHTTEKESAGGVTISVRNGASSSSAAPATSGAADAVSGAAGSLAGTAMASLAPSAPREHEEISKRIERREAELRAAGQDRVYKIDEARRVVEGAAKDRERKAAEDEKARLARRQRAEDTMSGVKSGCTIKPVMTDAEIDACRRASR